MAYAVPGRPAVDREALLPRPHQEILHPRGQARGGAAEGDARNQHANLHRPVPPAPLSYTLVEDVVIYYVRLRDLNSHEEWTFKTRYSELRNVHDALEESNIKNLYLPYHADRPSPRRRSSASPMRVPRTSRSAVRNWRSTLTRSSTRRKCSGAMPFATSSKSPRSRPSEIRSWKPYARRKTISHDPSILSCTTLLPISCTTLLPIPTHDDTLASMAVCSSETLDKDINNSIRHNHLRLLSSSEFKVENPSTIMKLWLGLRELDCPWCSSSLEVE